MLAVNPGSENKGGTFELDIHGFTPDECDQFTSYPRAYWNGCSTSEPKIEDWLPKGWKYKIEYFNSTA